MTRLKYLEIKFITDKYQGKWLNTVDIGEFMVECMAEFSKWHMGVMSKAWMKLLRPPAGEQKGRFATVPLLTLPAKKLANSDIDN